jgi:urease accessory protein UreH
MPTTTAAARLLPRSLNPGAEDSEQRMNFSIGDGSMLEYLPDPLIPFAGSRHGQRTSFSLGRDATLIWWEVLAHTFPSTACKFPAQSIFAASQRCAKISSLNRQNDP